MGDNFSHLEGTRGLYSTVTVTLKPPSIRYAQHAAHILVLNARDLLPDQVVLNLVQDRVRIRFGVRFQLRETGLGLGLVSLVQVQAQAQALVQALVQSKSMLNPNLPS